MSTAAHTDPLGEDEAVGRHPPGRVAGWRQWQAVVLAPAGDGLRRRRGSDAFRLIGAVLGVLICLLIMHYGYRVDRTLTRVFHPPPGSISWLVTAVYQGFVLAMPVLLFLVMLVARRTAAVRDLLASVGCLLLASGLLVLFLGQTGGRGSAPVIAGYVLDFPVLAVGLMVAVVTALLPFLARWLQRTVETAVVLVVLAAVVSGQGLPVSVLGSLALAWGATALVHLVFGSPLGIPSTADVALLMHELGFDARHVRPAPDQEWGVATYRADQGDGAGDERQQLAIAVYGRDDANAKLLSKAARFALYRDSGPTLSLTRLQEVEHQAYVTLRMAQLGVPVPEILEAGKAGPRGDAVVVSRPPAGTPLMSLAADDVQDGALDQLFGQLMVMRAARLAHGELSAETIVLDPATQAVGLVDLRSASTNAPRFRLDRDLAAAIATLSIVVGPERAGAAAARCLPAEVLEPALRHLRRAGLGSRLASQLRGRARELDEVRQVAADAEGIEVPDLIEPRRLRWATVVLVLGSVIGGWALLGVLIDVANSFDTVTGANWLWVAAVFVLAQLGFVGSAVEDLGSVAGELPFIRVLALEVANAFSALAGGTAAVFATRIRFFQQQGYDVPVAMSSSGVVTATSWLVKGVLLVIALPLAWSSLDLEQTPAQGSPARTLWLIVIAVVVVGVLAGLALAVPRVRRLASERLRPKLRDVWANARGAASSPRKVVQLLGGAVFGQLAVALALSTALRAFGDHLSLATLIIVITLAGMLGGVSPVPGGVGVVEAGMILGLTAAGIKEADATAAVFVQRLFTSYLPPLWGWFTLMWMRRRDYV